MDELVDDLAHLGELDDLAYLLCTHVVEVLPRELLLFLDLPQHLLGYALELTQRRHRVPLAPLNHLAGTQQGLAHLSPASLHADLKEATEDATRTLSHVDHV